MDDFGRRCIALSDAYDLELRRVAHSAWKELSKENPKQMAMHEGVYGYIRGPKYLFQYRTMDPLMRLAMKPEQNVECL